MTYKGLAIAALIFCSWACGGSNDVSRAMASVTPVTVAQDKKVSMENVTTNGEPQKRSDIGLTAKFDRTESEIVIEYTIKNDSRGDIYVLDAQPALNRESREGYAELKNYFLCKSGPETAVVLRGILPLPIEPVNRRIMPLGTKVEPQGHLTRRFSVSLPLTEQNDMYVPRLDEVDKYTKDSVTSLSFRVQFIRSSVEEFKAEPASFASGFYQVRSKMVVKDAETLRSEFYIGAAEILTRPDLFSRIQ